MAGGNPPPPKHPQQQSSFSAQSHHRKSRWESSSSSAAAAGKSKPSPSSTTANNKQNPLHKPSIASIRPDKPSPRPENPNSLPNLPFPDPIPPPSYGFHMLDRRSIVLVDGSVRSYFALPPDYENFKPIVRPGFRPELGLERPPFQMSPGFERIRNPEYWNSNGPQKRKFGVDDERSDGLERQRQQLLQYGNANGPGSSVLGREEEMRAAKNMRIHEGNVSRLKHNGVSQTDLKKAFFHFVKLVFETGNQRQSYLADGKQGPLRCLACRASKDFPDAHSLVMHAYNTDSADSVVDHLAFHKALCVLMGWNYLMPPDNSKAYQKLSADEAEANQDDLIMWPPSVLIHNTIIGKGRDGRMEGTGNRAMDGILRDLGFTSGKSMSLYSREGHLGIHTVKFSSDESGLKEALRLAEYFEREKRGRKAWAHVQSATQGKDDENNPNLVKLDPKTGEKKRIFFGHMATVADLDKVTFEIKKKVSVISRREFRQSKSGQ